MARPIVRIHDLATDEIIDREMTDAEFTEWQSDQAANEAANLEAEAKATEKAALLAKLGITAEEAALLLA